MNDAVLRRRKVQLPLRDRKHPSDLDLEKLLRGCDGKVSIRGLPDHRPERSGHHGWKQPANSSHPVALSRTKGSSIAGNDGVAAGEL